MEHAEATEDEVILDLNNITKSFGEVKAVSNVSLSIYDNEIIALVGDNGAGKSTLIKIIAGVLQPDMGEIRIKSNGELERIDITDPNDAKEVGIETVFQDLQLSKQHDIAKNIFMGREPTRDGLLGRLGFVDRELMEERSVSTLDEIDFQIDPKAITNELSGGQQQAVAVARALISNPQIILMDEPTSEVSVEGSEKILDLASRLKQEGRTIIFVTHKLEEVFAVADRIAVLLDGQLVDVLENDGSVSHQDVVSRMTGGS